MKFESSHKLAKMKRAFARLERINTNTGHSISTADIQDATEDFVSHAYHFKDFLKEEFPGKAQRIEEFITSSRELSLVADLQNSFKHAEDIKNRRKKHEQETGSPAIGNLVRINTHTKLDEKTWTWSQRLEITFRNAKFDAYDLAAETVKAWEGFLAAESIVLDAGSCDRRPCPRRSGGARPAHTRIRSLMSWFGGRAAEAERGKRNEARQGGPQVIGALGCRLR